MIKEFWGVLVRRVWNWLLGLFAKEPMITLGINRDNMATLKQWGANAPIIQTGHPMHHGRTE